MVLRVAGCGAWLLCLVACGGSTHAGSGGSAQGGSQGGAGAAGGSSSHAGSPPQAGGGGQAGGGSTNGSAYFPGSTAQEEEALAPLFVDPSEFATADVAELVEWAAKIGLARGFAMCRCAPTFQRPPGEVGELLVGCAADESGGLRNFLWYPSAVQGVRGNSDLARCLAEAPEASPGLTDGLRCELERHQRDGRNWLELCAIPGYQGDSAAWPPPAASCANGEALQRRLEECFFVGYCADGSRIALQRCDERIDCADASDEHGCFEITGHDMLQCGDELFRAGSLCDRLACGTQTDPPLCDPARPDRFLCANGSDISNALVCDRISDCPDNTDEQYCLR